MPRVVRVVGTGLLGTSLGLALRLHGARVLLSDPSPSALALAGEVGAGEPDSGMVDVDMVVVAAPPDVIGEVVACELARHPAATVTDVASVKSPVVAAVRAAGGDLRRFVPGHPMSGRERSGPIVSRADLFVDRPWVLCPPPECDPGRVNAVRAVAAALGATVFMMPAPEHDAAVALVSHLPQVASSLVAARMAEAHGSALALVGPGARDVTRIAASDPSLWAQILAANAGPVVEVLAGMQDDLAALVAALRRLAGSDGSGPLAPPGRLARGPRATVAGLVAAGNAGHGRLPGKHGRPATAGAVVTVLVPDSPGALAMLFQDVARSGANVEEIALEHSPGRSRGLLELSVVPDAAAYLEESLRDCGWRVLTASWRTEPRSAPTTTGRASSGRT